MIVEHIASQSSVIFETQCDCKDPIFGVYVSPGSAEILVRRVGIANHYSIAYSLHNTLNHLCQKLPKSVDVRLSYCVLHQCRFLDTM